MMTARGWAGDTFGNGWMHGHLIRLLKYTGVRPVYAFAGIFIVPFCVIFNRSGRFSYRFYRRRLTFGAVKSLIFTFRNHICFAKTVIDRFATYAGRHFSMEVEGDGNYKSLVSRPEAFAIFSSHIGNYELAGYTLGSERKKIHALVYPKEKKSVMDNRNNMFDGANVCMIELADDMGPLFKINEAICNGDIVSFPADRHMDGAKCISCDFLGAEAEFPQGPFSVATMRGLDVIAVNVMKTCADGYKVIVTPLPYDKKAPGKEKAAQLCRSYVRELERTIREYPDQWFNLFDFWK